MSTDLEFQEQLLETGILIAANRDKEYSRDVKCELCRDYYRLGFAPRNKNFERPLWLCTCDGARDSTFYDKYTSISVALDKNEVVCRKCQKNIVEYSEVNLKTYCDNSKYMLICCRECWLEMQGALDKWIVEQGERIEAFKKMGPELKKKPVMKDDPIISSNELLKKFADKMMGGK